MDVRLLDFRGRSSNLDSFVVDSAKKIIGWRSCVGRSCSDLICDLFARGELGPFEEFFARYSFDGISALSALHLGCRTWSSVRLLRISRSRVGIPFQPVAPSREAAVGFSRDFWDVVQSEVWGFCEKKYVEALENGIYCKSASSLLPMTISVCLEVEGTVRSWIGFLTEECGEDRSLEVRMVCRRVLSLLEEVAPVTVYSICRYYGVVGGDEGS